MTVRDLNEQIDEQAMPRGIVQSTMAANMGQVEPVEDDFISDAEEEKRLAKYRQTLQDREAQESLYNEDDDSTTS